jgi:signal transduction histidine kinase
MELNLKKNFHYFIIGIISILVLLLGFWWVYLILHLANSLSHLTASGLLEEKMFNMLKWEGITFFILLMILSSYLMYFYFQNIRKTKNLSDFFSSLTHELKTPLTSIRMQAEIISELLKDNSNKKIQVYLERLNQDTLNLENEIDNTLQLSRIYKGVALPVKEIHLKKFIEKISAEFTPINIQLETNLKTQYVLADEQALKIIFRNLISNTIRHNPSAQQISINLSENNQNLLICYHDHGKPFSGDIKLLATPFYKFNSAKGSGIGLYLIKNLTQAMNGEFSIINHDYLMFQLTLPKVKDI